MEAGTRPEQSARVVRVMVVDDHPIVAESLVAILEADGAAEVVTRATCGQNGIARHRPVQPDVTVLDRHLPDMDGLDVAAAIMSEQPDARILILSAEATAAAIRKALEIGCFGYIVKTARPDDIRAAVRDVAQGRTVVPTEFSAELAAGLRGGRSSDRTRLSAREHEVLKLLCEGHDTNAIASMLGLSPLTVKTHLSRLYSKLEVHDRAAAVAKAFRDRIVDC